MTQAANPEMLILARESRGLTQSELAEKSGVSQGNLSKYESGIRTIPTAHVEKFADVLDYPIEFFYLAEQRYGFGSSCTYHRKRQTMPVYELRTLLAKINIFRIEVARLLNGVEIEGENRFERLDLDDFDGDVERIAQYIRRKWELPFGPIQSVSGAIENAGGIVFRCQFGTSKVDAISQWTPGMPPVFFINEEIPGDRLRFTLAHELGHIIMHQVLTLDPRDMEREADRFAAEFLMPTKEIAPDFDSVTLANLVRMKSYWKVSMAGLAKRAYDLSKITPRQYRALFEQMSKLGYRTKEPEPVPVEEPTLAREILDVYQNDQHYSIAELSRLVVLNEHEFRAVYGYGPRKFRVVTSMGRIHHSNAG
jgi:Zn-dependent peptidase ImmA (M78 family)/DNA-binding XRE family transcriptional regulator